MNEKLQKLINQKKEQEKRLNKALIDEDDKEKRAAIGDTLRALHDEIDALMGMAEDAGEKQGEDNANDGDANGERKPDEGRSAMTGNAGAFKPLATYGAGKAEQRGAADNDPTNSLEYRAAFRDYVATGKATMPAEMRGDANTLTTDVPSVIPTVIMNRIIEGITACGMIIREVTRTAYAAGLVVPTSSVKPVATWTTEGGTTDRQKKITGSVTFTHFKLRCEISMSAEVSAMAISAFEDAFVANVVDAMIVAIEKAIIAGTGTGQPTGILTQTVPTGQTITIADTTTHKPTYSELCAAEAALPVEYENTAKWFMTKKQFMAFVGMVDDNGQPIARVDYGIENGAVRRLLGREVIVHPYATEMGSDIAGIYDFRDYVLNTIFDLGIQRKQDWDTEDYLTKAVMSVDGKPVSAASLVVMQ